MTVFVPACVLWVFGWLAGVRLCRRLGVTDPAGRMALGAAVPVACLVSSVHVLALVSMFISDGVGRVEGSPDPFDPTGVVGGGSGVVSPAWVLLLFAAFQLILLSAAFRCRDSGSESGPQSGANGLARGNWWLLPVFIALITYAVFALDALFRFPSGSDALHYHLPVAMRWVQTQRLDLLFGLHHQSFPENGMIPVMLLGFGDLERLFSVAQLPSAFLAGLSIFGLARLSGLGFRGGLVSALLALLFPMVVFQSFSGYVDLYGASAWLASLLGVCWAGRVPSGSGRWCLVVLAGLMAGVALGSKTTYLLLVLLLVVVLVVFSWRWCGSRRFGTVAVTISLFAVSLLPCSMHWFARGSVQAGNPVYPPGVTVGQSEVLPGFSVSDDGHFTPRTVGQKVSDWWHYPWTETKHTGTGYPLGRGSGFGAAYAAFVPAGVLFCLLGLLFPGRFGFRHDRLLWLVVTCLSLAGVVLLLTLFVEMLRFVLPLLLLSCLPAGLLFERLAVGRPVLTCGVFCCSLAVTGMTVALPAAHAFTGRMLESGVGRARYYGVPSIVDGFPSGTRILNLADAYATYPLMGSGWTNEVITPLHWRMLTGGGEVSRSLLSRFGVDFVYAREAQVEALGLSWLVRRASGRPGIILSEPGVVFAAGG